MKVFIYTLGCKVNTYESEFIKEIFLHHNDIILDDINNFNKADVIIINTCSVTNQADIKSRKMINRFRANKQAILVVCGCSAQYNQERFNDLGIDILIGTKDKSKIRDLVLNYKLNQKKINRFFEPRNFNFENMSVPSFHNKTRAFVKIQDGCNNYCSYCVIPLLRGVQRSKDFSLIIDEVKCLVKNHHQEIVLTGIHTGSYSNNDYDLVDLINEISKITKLKRIRISSIEITEINDKFLKMFNENPKLCDHLHIPLQSGCDDILKNMNRKYSKSKYESIIKRIRDLKPNINITTDVIVGFPGETDEQFQETYDFCKKIGFGKIHVFPYSVRSNTKASLLKNQLPNNIKKERTHQLLKLSDELEMNYLKKFVNQKVSVLTEQVSDYTIGHTSNYLKIKIEKKLETNIFYEGTVINVENNMGIMGE